MDEPQDGVSVGYAAIASLSGAHVWVEVDGGARHCSGIHIDEEPWPVRGGVRSLCQGDISLARAEVRGIRGQTVARGADAAAGVSPKESAHWRILPLLEDNVGEIEWERRPDCAYWLFLKGFNQRYRFRIQNCALVRDWITCPYFTVESKRDGDSEDVAVKQVAAAGFLGGKDFSGCVGTAARRHKRWPVSQVQRSSSPRSDAEKLDLVCDFMRREPRWGVSDLVAALASSEGPSNSRRKAAFVAAAYKDLDVLKSYLGNADYFWGDGRQSIIEILDLGNNELRKEAERLGTLPPFNKSDPTSKNVEFDALDMDQTLNMIQTEAPLLFGLIRSIIEPESRRTYQRQKEPFGRIVAIISILCFSQRQNTCTGFRRP